MRQGINSSGWSSPVFFARPVTACSNTSHPFSCFFLLSAISSCVLWLLSKRATARPPLLRSPRKTSSLGPTPGLSLASTAFPLTPLCHMHPNWRRVACVRGLEAQRVPREARPVLKAPPRDARPKLHMEVYELLNSVGACQGLPGCFLYPIVVFYATASVKNGIWDAGEAF